MRASVCFHLEIGERTNHSFVARSQNFRKRSEFESESETHLSGCRTACQPLMPSSRRVSSSVCCFASYFNLYTSTCLTNKVCTNTFLSLSLGLCTLFSRRSLSLPPWSPSTRPYESALSFRPATMTTARVERLAACTRLTVNPVCTSTRASASTVLTEKRCRQWAQQAIAAAGQPAPYSSRQSATGSAATVSVIA